MHNATLPSPALTRELSRFISRTMLLGMNSRTGSTCCTIAESFESSSTFSPARSLQRRQAIPISKEIHDLMSFLSIPFRVIHPFCLNDQGEWDWPAKAPTGVLVPHRLQIKANFLQVALISAGDQQGGERVIFIHKREVRDRGKCDKLHCFRSLRGAWTFRYVLPKRKFSLDWN